MEIRRWVDVWQIKGRSMINRLEILGAEISRPEHPVSKKTILKTQDRAEKGKPMNSRRFLRPDLEIFRPVITKG